MSTLFKDDEIERAELERSLPELQGTEKQVRWARVIRNGKLKEIDSLLRTWAYLVDTHKRNGRHEQADREQAARSQAYEALAGVAGEARASWWIDHRVNTAPELVTGADAKPSDSYTGEGGFFTR